MTGLITSSKIKYSNMNEPSSTAESAPDVRISRTILLLLRRSIRSPVERC